VDLAVSIRFHRTEREQKKGNTEGTPPVMTTFARSSTSSGAAQTLCRHYACARRTVATRDVSHWVNCVLPSSMAALPLQAGVACFVIFVGVVPTKLGKALATKAASIIA